MSYTAISIIIPCCREENNLDTCIESLLSQTLTDMEIICVADGTADQTLKKLNYYEKKDNRVRVLFHECNNLGAAMNAGLSNARGKYIIFLDLNILFLPDSLKKLFLSAENSQADIVVYDYVEINESGKKRDRLGIRTEWISENKQMFNYTDCPSNILRITQLFTWNKLFSNKFLQIHELCFDDSLNYCELPFLSVSMVLADKILHCTNVGASYYATRHNEKRSLEDIYAALSRTSDQLDSLPNKEKYQYAIKKFVIETFVTAMKENIVDFSDVSAREFYGSAHETFNGTDFLELKKEDIGNDQLFRAFLTIQKHDYKTMHQLSCKKIVVSMTSFPERISFVPRVIQTILSQTYRADTIVLWLAEEQFPGKESNLPASVISLINKGILTVRWCDNLMAHKKYFYAFQEYEDSLVVTIDDDILYPNDMLRKLWESYLLYPNAVSAMRCHLVVVDEKGMVLPYKSWIMETDACIYQPSMQLMATGGGGTLYPPKIFDDIFFDKDAIMECCPLADDLWLKAMQLVSDIPVVLASNFLPLSYVPGSQEKTLHSQNVGNQQNDIQLTKISHWLDKRIRVGILAEKLTSLHIGKCLYGIASISDHLDRERKNNRWKRVLLERQIVAEKEKNASIYNEKETMIVQNKLILQQLEQSINDNKKLENTLLEYRDSLSQLEHSIQELDKKQRDTEAELLQTRANAPINKQLEAVGKQILDTKNTGSAAGYAFKRFIYFLAWFPEKLLEAMMYYLSHGMKETLKQIYHKLLCHKY